MTNSSMAYLALATTLFSLIGCTSEPDVAGPSVAFAPGASLSENAALADALQRSLSGFLEPLDRGELSDVYSDPVERERYALFYKSLVRGAQGAEPVVLKSYPLNGDKHMVTVAFMTGVPDALAISRIVELEAIPDGEQFQFRCPYAHRTSHFKRRTVGNVIYRFSGDFNEVRATEFARFKARFEAIHGIEGQQLQYDCFQSLDELLKAYGLVHDASKCNFLQHDLGFLSRNGQKFTTGTGDESYIFGYLCGALASEGRASETNYQPYATGVAAYYGGYGLSGDSMEVLAHQFREELKRRPTIDFLEEFKKGRKSSVNRHFSHFVMCAFLCRAIIARHGEAAALKPLQSGAEGETFFTHLEALLGVNEDNFHASIVGLIAP